MKPEDHAALTTKARQIIQMEKQASALSTQMKNFRKDGVPEIALRDIKEARDMIRRSVNRWKAQLGREWSDLPVARWADSIHGLGDAVILTLGVIPPLTDFANPAKLWKYGGFAPGQGPRKGQDHSYSRELKSFAIMRLAKPCMQSRESPYRRVYDDRRARTLTTHPEWSDGHYHNDALRITAKAILKDLWCVANGKSPSVGPPSDDTQVPSARPDSPSNGRGGHGEVDVQSIHDSEAEEVSA